MHGRAAPEGKGSPPGKTMPRVYGFILYCCQTKWAHTGSEVCGDEREWELPLFFVGAQRAQRPRTGCAERKSRTADAVSRVCAQYRGITRIGRVTPDGLSARFRETSGCGTDPRRSNEEELDVDATFQRYVALMKVVQYKSFSRAAEALQYSQPAISRMIKGLEDDFGVPLLERSGKGVYLTSDGQELMPYIERVCAMHSKLQDKVSELTGMQSGTIRIASFSSVMTYWLPDVIKRFQEEYPNINYELLDGDYSEIEDWVIDGRVDLGIAPLPISRELETDFLYREQFHVILPQGHPLTEYERIPPQLLEQYPFILTEKGGKSVISLYFEQQAITPEVRFVTWDDYAAMRMVERGLGISILPDKIVERAPYDIVRRDLEVPLYRDVVLAVRDHKALPRLARQLVEYMPRGDAAAEGADGISVAAAESVTGEERAV